MTAESVIKSVLNIINLKKQTINMSDDDIIQINQFLNETGKELIARVRWSSLIKEVLVVGNVSFQILPNDFQQLSLSGGIMLNKASYTPCRIVTSKTLWQFLQKKISEIYYAIINSNKIEFSKTLDSDGAKYYYFSKNWIANDKHEVSETADIPLISENLLIKGTVYRWKREKGLNFTDELSEYEALIAVEEEASMGL